jgi:DNA replication protein DnaC
VTTNPFEEMLAKIQTAEHVPCDGGCGRQVWDGTCDDCRRARDERRRQRELVEQVDRTIPATYRWANFAAPELAARVRGSVAAGAAAVAHPRVVLVGPSGCGKTSLAVAMMRKRVAVIGERAAFVHAFRLGVARIQHAAGDGEPAIVETAMRVPLLLLDDVGTERQTATNAVADVILERHAEGRATWVTTWLSPREAAEKYGGGVARRIFEDCKVIKLGTTEGGR